MKKFQIGLVIVSYLICNLLNALVYVNGYSDSSSPSDSDTFSKTDYPGATLAIKAVNPGYSIEGIQNVGEFIELVKLADDSSPLPLDGYTLRYTTKSGNTSDLYVFPEGSRMVGTNLLLRLASSPEASQADLTYTKTLALDAGPLELVYNSEVKDSVCWTGSDLCYSKFLNKSGSRTMLVQDLGTKTFAHVPVENYQPTYDPQQPSYLPPVVSTDDEEAPEPKCRDLEFSEILTYYDEDKSEQFIELYNNSEDTINMSGCTVKYKSKFFSLDSIIESGGYYIYRPDIALTKNPTTSNNYELIDITGDVIDTLILPHGQKKSTSYAQFGYYNDAENWLATYSPTPGGPNNYQQYRSCPEGKVINESTGNCVKAATIAEVKECPAGKYRNPLTGRCKSIEEDGVLAPCKEGYERNPDTGRCRKIRNNDGASYPLVPTTATEKTSFIAGLAIASVLLVGIVYIVLQYRPEISRFFKAKFSKQKLE
ncbi:lamin tail domain-containing protein [Candidatus Saccharibacteria bacterium]|nr:lamin tail domain-containing protein [Candidatus Saccharibacteria bacterium]